jgi:hypothetical protein
LVHQPPVLKLLLLQALGLYRDPFAGEGTLSSQNSRQ